MEETARKIKQYDSEFIEWEKNVLMSIPKEFGSSQITYEKHCMNV